MVVVADWKTFGLTRGEFKAASNHTSTRQPITKLILQSQQSLWLGGFPWWMQRHEANLLSSRRTRPQPPLAEKQIIKQPISIWFMQLFYMSCPILLHIDTSKTTLSNCKMTRGNLSKLYWLNNQDDNTSVTIKSPCIAIKGSATLKPPCRQFSYT